ncbi:hypothetical protein N7495_009393 [Penicillium taxi]|uniref:uncharacterized protein n=1 Tax=Penicillium taxi TaxID=168475 RepID=UPI0025453377|nr:uncharacterized protein N7495_009393 [Penicillium taxi]KAJ5884883.1 hypothetical protein N7495_009393 [Penicillium taxi]
MSAVKLVYVSVQHYNFLGKVRILHWDLGRIMNLYNYDGPMEVGSTSTNPILIVDSEDEETDEESSESDDDSQNAKMPAFVLRSNIFTGVRWRGKDGEWMCLFEQRMMQNIIANKDGLDITRQLTDRDEEIKQLEEQVTSKGGKNSNLHARIDLIEQQMQDMLTSQEGFLVSQKGLLAMQHSYYNVRQRTISSWIQYAFSKDSAAHIAAIRETNKLMHGGDITIDSRMVLEVFSKQLETKHFPLLYGLSATETQEFYPKKCVESTKALDRMASALLNKNSQQLSAGPHEKRDALVT